MDREPAASTCAGGACTPRSGKVPANGSPFVGCPVAGSSPIARSTWKERQQAMACCLSFHVERAMGLEPATGHPTNGEPFAGTLPDLGVHAPPAQVEAAGSRSIEKPHRSPRADASRRKCGVTSVLPKGKTLAQGRFIRPEHVKSAEGVHKERETAGPWPVVSLSLWSGRRGSNPLPGVPRMASHSREPYPTSDCTRLRRRWK